MGNGTRLKKLLDERGIKVSELARDTGIAPQTIYAIIKRDNKKIDAVVATKMADALCLDLSEFISYLDSDFSEQHNIPIEGSARYDFDTESNKMITDTIHNMESLNDVGKKEAAKRVEELTYIDKYTKRNE